MKSLIKKYFDRVPSDKDEAFVELQGDFAVQLEETLKDLNWTQRDMSKHSGINAVNINRILSGENNTTLKTIAALQAAAKRRMINFPWVEEKIAGIERDHAVEGAYGTGAVAGITVVNMVIPEAHFSQKYIGGFNTGSIDVSTKGRIFSK